MASDTDVQYYCTTALSNIAVDANNRKRLGQEPVLVEQLIVLMSSPSMKIQCQAALALRNLASDGNRGFSLVFINIDIPNREIPIINCHRKWLASVTETSLISASFTTSRSGGLYTQYQYTSPE